LAHPADVIVMLRLTAWVMTILGGGRKSLRQLLDRQSLGSIPNKYKEAWSLVGRVWQVFEKSVKPIGVLEEGISLVQG